MPLYDNPPHRADFYTSTSSTDAGGGSQISYSLAQGSVPCFAPSVSAGEQERFAQTQIVTEHTIYMKASALTITLVRGMKVVVNGATLHVTGINTNQAAGTIPSLAEVKCENLA